MLIGECPIVKTGALAAASWWLSDQLQGAGCGHPIHRALRGNGLRVVVLRHGGSYASKWRVTCAGTLVTGRKSFARQLEAMRWGGLALVALPCRIADELTLTVYDQPLEVLSFEARENRRSPRASNKAIPSVVAGRGNISSAAANEPKGKVPGKGRAKVAHIG